jgi:ornithine cyclodeaminase
MKTSIFTLEQIKEVLDELDPIQAIEEGFVAYSKGRVVVPPVGEMLFEDPPGDCHIKYGFIKGDDYYVVKIASGFYENIHKNIPPNTGLMLLFKQATGEVASILLDEGYLTNVRTAAAGAVAAKHLAPQDVYSIGIFGAGTQARMQIEFLDSVVDCRRIIAWGVNQEELDKYQSDMEQSGYQVETTLEPRDIAERCNLIVTATPSKKPLLQSNDIHKGTHITAMGSDTPQKQELDSEILAKADLVVADSLVQSQSRGEIYRATMAGVLQKDVAVELGQVISNPKIGRTNEDQITVVDLTGVAVQDIQISKIVYETLIAQTTRQ